MMPHDALQEALRDADRGDRTVTLDDPPEWLDTGAECPVCGAPVGDHDSVRVADASAEVFACSPDGISWLTLPTDPLW